MSVRPVRLLVSALSRIIVYSPSHDDDRPPLRDMLHTWLLYIMVPAGLLAWGTTHRPSVVVAATLATPCLAIFQGAMGILSFRLNFGDAPLPCTPSHGVVIVQPDDEASEDLESPNNKETQSTVCIQQALEQPPIRLLVIGDSLAIGVGQSKSPTPIMPEVIAKTLSKKLNGRVVYWTCHGAPGASTGWIARELERGANYRDQGDDDSDDDAENDLGDEIAALGQKSCSISDTDDSSSSDESSSGSAARKKESSMLAIRYASVLPATERKQWKDRLFQHSKRFYDPNRLGPYDVVVILTGSNDLKSAFFPFLLTGEDAEFRRQAKLRGGSYGLELRRLLETLELKMTMQFKNFRATVINSVEAATERIQGSIEETMERFAPGSSQRLSSFRLAKGDSVKAIHDGNDEADACDKESPREENITLQESPSRVGETRPFPVIVLPGMPSRTLPIFRRVPLRWLSVPIVDIMDSHKRSLANSYPGDLLFVKAPGVEDLADYEARRGSIWADKFAEKTVLSLTDVGKREHHRVEEKMRSYFQERGESAAEAIEKASALSWRWFWFRSKASVPAGFDVFSVDQIHPNEKGYDFWGRYIADAVVNELQRKSNDM